MDALIMPSKLFGQVNAISSKSYAHRLIVLSALADRPTKIFINCFSKDIMRTIDCVSELGCDVLFDQKSVTIYPIKSKNEFSLLDFGESGTTARFMLPMTGIFSDKSKVFGHGRLTKRPMKELCDALRDNGLNISSDFIPLEIIGNLRSGEYNIKGNISSQYISALLMVLPYLEGESKINITTNLESEPYINITIDSMSLFSVNVEKTSNGYNTKKSSYISPQIIDCEGDWSNSSIYFVANKLGANIDVIGLKNNSVQGDRKITELLDSTEIDVSEIPDLVPILSVLAAGRNEKTVFKNAGRLKLKESDRIKSVVELINLLGGEAFGNENSITILGKGKLRGGIVDSFNDHRIVMAATIAASLICTDNVLIHGFEAIEKSYPRFINDFTGLGGRIDVNI